MTSMDIFFTRPEIRRTNPMDIMAPANAASIMPPELMDIPLPSKRIMTRDTTSLAPEEIPSTNGPAMGFAKKACSKKPDTDSAPPSMTADRMRGRRISHTIWYAVPSPVCLSRIFPISPADRRTLPKLIFQKNSRHIMAPRSPNEMQYCVYVLLDIGTTPYRSRYM